MNTINYNNILNPNLALDKIKDRLIEIYMCDYGIEYKELIEERINNTIFIFDSNPLITRNYIIKNLNKIKDRKFILRTEIEYLDYIKEKRKIEKELEDEFINFLAGYPYYYYGIDRNALLNMDFESYSTENMLKLENENTPELKKEIIRRRQMEYKINHFKFHKSPITDSSKIERIIQYKKAIEESKNEQLVKRTMWGKRIKKHIAQKYDISDYGISLVLFDNATASTQVIMDMNNESRTICYIPLIKNIEAVSLDRLLLHELRHVIEVNENSIGFDLLNDPKYSLLNEIRTDRNSILDKVKLSHNQMDNTIFSNINKGTSTYAALYDYIDAFIDNNIDILNKIAIKGKVKMLESLYGEDFLKSINDYLIDTKHKILQLIRCYNKDEKRE